MTRVAGATRLYVLEAADTKAERLVWAANKSRAVRMSATARIATHADLQRLFEQGVKPEGQAPGLINRPRRRA